MENRYAFQIVVEYSSFSVYPTGTKITYPNEGDEDPILATGDLVIIIEELQHQLFCKEQNDLIIKVCVTC